MTAQPEASGFWSGESNSNAAAWLVVEEANPSAFKGRLASFREIALAPLRLLFEPHAIVRAVLFGEAHASPLKRLLDTEASSSPDWWLRSAKIMIIIGRYLAEFDFRHNNRIALGVN